MMPHWWFIEVTV